MKKKLGELLLESGLITEDQLRVALEKQKTNQKKLGDTIVSLNMATAMDIAQTLAFQLGFPLIDFNKTVVEPEAVKLIPEDIAKKYEVMPYQVEDNFIHIAMTDPLDFAVYDDVRFLTGRSVRPALATRSDILRTMNKHYNIDASLQKLIDDIASRQTVEIVPETDPYSNVEELREKSERTPIIKIVNIILIRAIENRASDIHIEPKENMVLVRNRIDGLLNGVLKLPKWVQGAVTSRIKIMSKMDISEKRIPQDGRVKVLIEKSEMDLRISTLPVTYGEKVVIRILDNKGGYIPLDQIGLTAPALKGMHSLVSKPQGVLLVTGPTGSGKTTTLYAILNHIKSEGLNIVTLENPVEYEVGGVNQVQINEKAGLTFASGLRSILRQDPNVVMVGEIRDQETAQIAMQASLTGHFVLSTLHTNDAVSSITRLIDMGVQPYLIGSSVVGIIAQRLVRVICSSCKERYDPAAEELLKLGIRPGQSLPIEFYHGTGCENCNMTGYRGRIGVFEILIITTKVREQITVHSPESMIRKTAISQGMRLLGQDGMQKIKDGITTIDELARVIYKKEELSTVCPSCRRTISLDFVVCPYCSYQVANACPSCGEPSQPDWNICPYCRQKFSKAS